MEPKQLQPWSHFMVRNSAPLVALFWCLNMIIKEKTASPSKVAPFSKTAPGWSHYGFTFFSQWTPDSVKKAHNWPEYQQIKKVSPTVCLRIIFRNLIEDSSKYSHCKIKISSENQKGQKNLIVRNSCLNIKQIEFL